VHLDVARRSVRLPPDAGLDLGGIAKGWLADMVLCRLRPFGAAAIDMGGDCAVSAPAPHAPPWVIDIADPWADGRTLATIPLRHGGGVATSGVTRRRWQTSAGVRHHLIDPRSGQSATTDLASVTVIGPSAAGAEVMAKVVLLLGREQGATALEGSERFRGVLVPADGPAVTVGMARVW
jgi:thiamine biosynthesis lipoprotein